MSDNRAYTQCISDVSVFCCIFWVPFLWLISMLQLYLLCFAFVVAVYFLIPTYGQINAIGLHYWMWPLN